MRLFVAVDPGERFRAALSTLRDGWRARWPGRWEPLDRLHLTLRFLGDWPPDRLDDLRTALRGATAGRASGVAHAAGLGVFPGWRRPRVLYLQVVDEGALAGLAAAVDAALADRCPGLGAAAVDFRAHLTLARFREPPHAAAVAQMRSEPAPDLPDFPVDAVRLVESFLSPGGACHETREVFPLAGPTAP